MLIYWLLYAFFAVAATVGSAKRSPEDHTPGRPFLVLGAIFVVLVIGLRYKVGADWYAYQRMYDMARDASFDWLLNRGDPGYQFLNWALGQTGFQIWTVNLLAALVFAWGLVRLVTAQPYPWLGMLMAIPYMVVVVAMGYSRQSIALGFIMAALADISRGGTIFRFVFYIALAALFHRTAVVVLPLAAFVTRQNRWVNVSLIATALPLLFYAFLSRDFDDLIENYVGTKYASSGAAIRVALCLIPATLYFLFRKRLGLNGPEIPLWRNFSIASFVALVLLLTTPSSTAVDRLAVYLLPLQIAIYSRLPLVVRDEALVKFVLVVLGGAILFVWLNYADNAESWQNYRYFSPFD